MRRRVGVGPDVQRRRDARELQVMPLGPRHGDLPREGDIPGEHGDPRVNLGRDVVELHALSLATTLSSTAMGVGKARTSTVVRVAPLGPSSSA